MQLKSTFKPLLLTTALIMSFAHAQTELKSIGVTVGDLGNPFFVQIGKGAEMRAKEVLGKDVKVTVVSSGYDLNTQVAQIENFIASKVQLILLNAADSKGIAPAVKKAKAAGIIVIAVDVGAEGGVDATVTSNNFQAGEQACQYIVDKLKGEGNVIIINGPPVTAVMDRVAGCQKVFAANTGIKLLSDNQNAGGSRDGGLKTMADLLTAHKKLDAVFAINDPTGIGADLAARQAKRTQLFITGVDGAPDAEKALSSEKGLFEATAAQDPYAMAAKAVDVGIEILKGNQPTETTILIPTALVTKESIKDYKGWTSK